MDMEAIRKMALKELREKMERPPRVMMPESYFDTKTNTVHYFAPFNLPLEDSLAVEQRETRKDETQKIMDRLYELEQKLK